MTLEAMLSELSHEEKLVAMDLLWRDLANDPAAYNTHSAESSERETSSDSET